MVNNVKEVIKSNENLYEMVRKMLLINGVLKYKFYPERACKKTLENLLGREVNLKDPKTLTEKIMYINLYNQHRLAAKLADKYAVREYIKEKGYENILSNLIGVYEDANEIDFDSLPNEFVLKCNHGSGYNIICKNKKNLNIEQVKKKLNRWLKENYSYYYIETHYRSIEPKIICEKYIHELGNTSLHFVNGKHIFNQCYIEDEVEEKNAFYNTKWRRVNYTDRENDKDAEALKPKNYEAMVKIASDLSKPFKYIRIDFYDTERGPILSELTFTPLGCGISRGFRKDIDRKLGKLISHN